MSQLIFTIDNLQNKFDIWTQDALFSIVKLQSKEDPNLLQYPRKNNIFVHIKINTINLAENMKIFSNLKRINTTRGIHKHDANQNIRSFVGQVIISSEIVILQDLEVRSFLSHVSPFPVQVPADQKARFQLSAQVT